VCEPWIVAATDAGPTPGEMFSEWTPVDEIGGSMEMREQRWMGESK
jgi:hypothetical protein